MFGCGSVAQVVLSRGTHGGFLTINLAFGFAVTLGILVAGQVSGKASTPASVLSPHQHFQQVIWLESREGRDTTQSRVRTNSTSALGPLEARVEET